MMVWGVMELFRIGFWGICLSIDVILLMVLGLAWQSAKLLQHQWEEVWRLTAEFERHHPEKWIFYDGSGL